MPEPTSVSLSSYWIGQTLLYYILSLCSPQMPITVLSPMVQPARESNWIRLKTLHITNAYIAVDSILTAVLAGRQVFEETLEKIEVVGGSASAPREMEGRPKVVATILEMFKRLCCLNVMNAVVRAKDFFHTESITEATRAGNLGGGLKLRSWASSDIVSLMVRIEGPDRHWCPPEVAESLDGLGSAPVMAQDDGYPLYSHIKARLDGFAHLDQSQIRYQSL